MRSRAALFAFSHLRWDFVYQRPQHLLSRLARNRPVFFVEEPIYSPGRDPRWEVSQPAENVTVLRPNTPLREPGFTDSQLELLQPMVTNALQEFRVGDHAAWFYTPMALPLVQALSPRTVIYDCMDELSHFMGAPPQLVERERQLFHLADAVFTGGPSLFRSKQRAHHNVHCFPSSVDPAHFAAATTCEEAPETYAMSRPRVGYYGVIDERIDLSLVEALADAHPEWQIIMVGPVVKIDPSQLPRRPNIHYLGQQAYTRLPAFLKGWDVCLQPFARNDATKFISPTKTLEYMAARKPIVSTPITDVAEPYGHIVHLGDTPAAFIRAAEAAMSMSEREREQRLAAGDQVLSRTSWDRTVAQMETILESATAGRQPQRGASAHEAGTVVIGAGPTGLSAAYHLGERATLIDQNERVGGWCRSIEDKGFTFDYAGHIMFSADPYVHQLYKMLLGDNVHWQDREAWIYSKNVYTRYPFQGSLYGLPPEVIRECIVGAVEARYGVLRTSRPAAANGKSNGHTNGHAKPAAPACSKDASLTDCCADGVLEASAKLGKPESAGVTETAPRNFEEFIYKVWGAGIAKHFAVPYNRKLWAVPLHEMETSWLGGRVPMPDLEEMIDGALKPTPKPMGPNARFGYPLHGGFQALMDGFLPHLKGRLLLNRRVISVDPAAKVVTLDDGTQKRYGQLVSTMPLPTLVKLIGSAAPKAVQDAARKLRHVSVRCVNIGVGREQLTDKHWIYYPEDTVFHRIFVQGNASPFCNAPGGFGLTCEITYSPHKPLPCDGQELIDLCIRDCRRVGIFREDDPIWAANQVDMPYAYVVYDHQRKDAVETIRQWAETQDIVLSGRYSEWEYYNSDHAFLAGRKAAEQALTLAADVQTRTLVAGLAASSASRPSSVKE